MNTWHSFDKTDRECSIAPTDDLIRLWRSKVQVKVTAIRQGKGIYVDDAKIFYLLILSP